jgi:hypothetical protein
MIANKSTLLDAPGGCGAKKRHTGALPGRGLQARTLAKPTGSGNLMGAVAPSRDPLARGSPICAIQYAQNGARRCAKTGPALLSTKPVDKVVDCAWAVANSPAKHEQKIGLVKISSPDSH